MDNKLNHQEINALKCKYYIKPDPEPRLFDSNGIPLPRKLSNEDGLREKEIVNSLANVSYGYSQYDKYPLKWDKVNLELNPDLDYSVNDFVNNDQQETAVVTSSIPPRKRVDPPLYPITLSSPNVPTGYVNNLPTTPKKPIYDDYYYTAQSIDLKNNGKLAYDIIEVKKMLYEEKQKIAQMMAQRGQGQGQQTRSGPGGPQQGPQQGPQKQGPPKKPQGDEEDDDEDNGENKQVMKKKPPQGKPSACPIQKQQQPQQPQQQKPTACPIQKQPQQQLQQQQQQPQKPVEKVIEQKILKTFPENVPKMIPKAIPKISEIRKSITQNKVFDDNKLRNWSQGRDVYSMEPRYTNVYFPNRQYNFQYVFQPNTDDYFVDNTRTVPYSPIIIPDKVPQFDPNRRRLAKTWKGEEIELARLGGDYQLELFGNLEEDNFKFYLIVLVIVLLYYVINNYKINY